MRLLAILTFIVLCSCQQRYGHVKKVKVDKTETVRNKEKEKIPADSGSCVRFSDSAEHHVPGQADGIAGYQESTSEPKRDGEGSIHEDPLVHPQKAKVQEYLKKIFLKDLQDKGKDLPLTTQERLFILSVFLIWTALLVAGVGYLVIELLAVYIFIGLFFGSASTALGAILLIGLVLFLLSQVAFFIGRAVIRRRIAKRINNFELYGYFLVTLLLVSLLATGLWSLIILAVLAILAMIYFFSYED